MFSAKFYRYVYLLVIFLRFSSLLLFLINPLFAWFFTLVLDTFDYSFALRGGYTYRAYQDIDKTLDLLSRVYFVVVAYFFAWPQANLFLILFMLRLVGDVLYFYTREEKYFFIFPNIIEYFFPLYIFLLPTPTLNNIAVILIISTLVKLGHEYFIHINKWIDPISLAYIKKHPEHKRKISQK